MMVHNTLEYGKVGIENSIGFTYAVIAFKTMWPTAISLAPGLMSAGIIAKVLVSEANFPGVFVMLMPWLYTPLTWSLYNIIMQVFGDPVLLCSLLIFSFHPVILSVLGGIENF